MSKGERRTFTEVVKENPLVTLMASVVLVAGLVTGSVNSLAGIDALIVTHAEHDADFLPLKDEVSDVKLWNRCDRLERKLYALEDRLWQRQHTNGVSADVIRELEKDIRDIQQQFDALGCAKILAGV